MIDPEWVSAIASCAALSGVIVAVRQLHNNSSQLTASVEHLNLTLKTLHADHERSRREKAVDLLMQWSTTLNKRGSLARKFVETLSFEQAQKIYESEPITGIDLKHLKLVAGCLNNGSNERAYEWEKEGSISLNASETDELRWEVVCYLNTLESILIAWRHNVADKEIIAEQFGFLVSKRNNHKILRDFRNAAGGRDTFPAIDDFENYLSQETVGGGKEKIGT